jgi:hypothetical protein
MSFIAQRGSMSATGWGRTLQVPAPTGAFLFWRSGTYSVPVPANVTSISMAAVGGGGGGSGGATSYSGSGGGGGALAYSNDIAVTPGEVLTIVVGAGGSGGYPEQAGYIGVDSTVSRGGTVLLRAAKGNRAEIFDPGVGGAAASCVGQFAFSGGTGGSRTGVNSGSRPGGGGGSGGWSGVGGTGGTNGGAGSNGTGGAGGGGASVTNNYQAGCSGGATLWYGEGASGVGRANNLGTMGSALGGALTGPQYDVNTSYSPNGSGGGGGYWNGYGLRGGDGWVRIVFGGGSIFPTTATSTNEITFVASANSTTGTVVVPASAKVGDLMVLVDVYDANTAKYSTTPTGFTSLRQEYQSSTYSGSNISAKQITSTSEIGSTITGTSTSSATYVNKTLLIFRGTRFASVGYAGTFNSYFDEATTYSQTLTQSGYVATYDPYAFGIPIAIGFFRGTSGINPATDITWSGATFIQGSTSVWQVGYKIFNQSITNVSETLSMVDRGTNTQVSALISVY